MQRSGKAPALFCLKQQAQELLGVTRMYPPRREAGVKRGGLLR
jgi:hypothetical protein